MLKLYRISYHHLNGDDTTFFRYILAYSECHAVNLFNLELDLKGESNLWCLDDCSEISFLKPFNIL